MEWIKSIKSILEILKLDRKSTFVVAMVCSALLVFKGFIEKHFNAQYFYSHFEMFVLIIALVMWFILISDAFLFFKSRFDSKREIRIRHKFLSKLSGRKLEIVSNMYLNNEHSGYLKQGDSDVLVLEQSGIILKTAKFAILDAYNMGEINNPPFPYTLQPWVVDYFDHHKGKIKSNEDD